MRPLLVALALSPLPCLAQDLPDLQAMPYLAEASVAGGTLSIEKAMLEDHEGQRLLFNGQPVEGIADSYVAIQGVMPIPETNGEDMAFVTVAGGGNGCPTLWAIVATSAAGVRATPPFGTRSEAILDLHLTEGAQVAFTMAPVSETGPWMLYTFDGYTVSELEVPAP